MTSSPSRPGPGPLLFQGPGDLQGDETARVRWYLDGLIGPGLVVLLAGKAKAGKSTLLLGALGALERGESFAGLRAAETSAVLISEEAPASLGEKLSRFHLEKVRVLTRSAMFPRRPLADVLDAAAEEGARVGAGIVVVDTFAAWAGLPADKEKDAGAVLEALDPVLRLVSRGLGVVLVHHHRKGGGTDGEGVRGSSALLGAVDVLLELDRPRERAADSVRVVSVLSRFADSPRALAVELAKDGYRAVADIRVAAAETLAARIVEALRTAARPLERDGVTAALGGKRSATVAALGHALREGLVVRSGAGRKGDPFLFSVPARPCPSPAPGRESPAPARPARPLPVGGEGGNGKGNGQRNRDPGRDGNRLSPPGAVAGEPSSPRGRGLAVDRDGFLPEATAEDRALLQDLARYPEPRRGGAR